MHRLWTIIDTHVAVVFIIMHEIPLDCLNISGIQIYDVSISIFHNNKDTINKVSLGIVLVCNVTWIEKLFLSPMNFLFVLVMILMLIISICLHENKGQWQVYMELLYRLLNFLVGVVFVFIWLFFYVWHCKNYHSLPDGKHKQDLRVVVNILIAV